MKPVVLIMIIALAGGMVMGAAMMGIIDIPGISPTKKKAAANAAYTQDKDKEKDAATAVAKKNEVKTDKPAPAVKKPTPPPVAAKPKDDPEAGRKKVAKLWNDMKPDTLVSIVSKGWKDDELALILVKMDSGNVSKLLAALPPDKASKLTKAIQKIASKP